MPRRPIAGQEDDPGRACALQIEYQVSGQTPCSHQHGKATVPRDEVIAQIRACRHALLELGIEGGIIVARTGSHHPSHG